MEYGSRKTEISAASCSHCIVLSHTARRAHAGRVWFSQNHQRQRNPQLEELARTLARQVTLNIAPLMRSETPDENRINAVLRQLTQESRILDAASMMNRAILLLALAKASMCATGWRWMAKSGQLF